MNSSLIIKMAFDVLAGLGIFLFGMKNMSDGMQAIAGDGLRKLISTVTNNRLLATSVGITVTCLVQSSSITTVMVVGFVNSGFMTLRQAIGVIMGSNIGTTITGWILVLKIGKYGLPLLGIFALVYLFSRNDRWRYFAMAVMGIGMVFFGLELMKNGFKPIKEIPEFEAWFQLFTADSYWGVLKCAFLGCILTLLVQSSSATLGITIALASKGVIPFETAAALVLGENIGTTITAALACIGTTTTAKRAAMAHVMFNVLGVLWVTALFQPYIGIIKDVAGFDQATSLLNGGQGVTTAIAWTHSGFNIVNTLLFLPLVGLMATFLTKMIPEKKVKEVPHLTAMDLRVMETPVIAVEHSRNEVIRMGRSCEKMMDWLEEIIWENGDKELRERLFHRENLLDTIQHEVVHYVGELLSGNVPHEIADEGRHQLRMADEYESVSDYLTQILKLHLRALENELEVPEEASNALRDIHKQVKEYLEFIHQGYEDRNPEVLLMAQTSGDRVTHVIKTGRDNYLTEFLEKGIDPRVSLVFSDMINAYRRVKDHTYNIAETLAGEK